MGGEMFRRPLAILVVVLLLSTGMVGTGSATHGPRHPFPDPDPNPRIGTPNDPGYDCTEPDDEDPDSPTNPNCSSVWEGQYNLFGFPPN
ncbi:MAG: hypothetical protein ACREUU_15350, partial [Gammaproteobacteria bacterium]